MLSATILSSHGATSVSSLPLHLHARRVTFSHPLLPAAPTITITAPLPAHMVKTFTAAGFTIK
jgi:hypothetical protein